jgi:fluoroquinolone transport system permease protein
MKRLLSTTRWEATLQQRNGFYIVSIAIVIAWGLLIAQSRSALQALDLRWLLPPFVLSNLIITTFYFVGGLLLLERDQRVLGAIAVSPLRVGEYVGAKLITLSLLALAENLPIVWIIYGTAFNHFWLSLGVVLGAALYVLSGFAVAARYRSINEYLLPSIAYATLVMLPLLPYLGGYDHPLLYAHPLGTVLLVTRAAWEPIGWWEIGFGVGYAILWIGIGFWAAARAWRRFVIDEGS